MTERASKRDFVVSLAMHFETLYTLVGAFIIFSDTGSDMRQIQGRMLKHKESKSGNLPHRENDEQAESIIPRSILELLYMK